MSESERLERLELERQNLAVQEELDKTIDEKNNWAAASVLSRQKIEKQNAALIAALTAIKHADHIEQAIDLACAALQPNAGRAISEPERQNAALRAALEYARNWFNGAEDENGELAPEYPLSRILDALAPDAGRDFIPREKVQPLVDALKLLQADGMPLDNSGQRPMHAWLNHETFVKARLALSHAKTLGFE